MNPDLVATGELFVGYTPEMERTHIENATALNRILDGVGWPGVDQVGAEAAEAAWLVAQHAISWPAFQRRCLALLTVAVDEGRAPRRHLAYLTDRVRCNERRPQVYGTIHDWDAAGEMSPWPIEDPEGVEERRRAAGLPPLDHPRPPPARTRRGRPSVGELGSAPARARGLVSPHRLARPRPLILNAPARSRHRASAATRSGSSTTNARSVR